MSYHSFILKLLKLQRYKSYDSMCTSTIKDAIAIKKNNAADIMHLDLD